jgi:hypothetical protein
MFWAHGFYLDSGKQAHIGIQPRGSGASGLLLLSVWDSTQATGGFGRVLRRLFG